MSPTVGLTSNMGHFNVVSFSVVASEPFSKRSVINTQRSETVKCAMVEGAMVEVVHKPQQEITMTDNSITTLLLS